MCPFLSPPGPLLHEEPKGIWLHSSVWSPNCTAGPSQPPPQLFTLLRWPLTQGDVSERNQGEGLSVDGGSEGKRDLGNEWEECVNVCLWGNCSCLAFWGAIVYVHSRCWTVLSCVCSVSKGEWERVFFVRKISLIPGWKCVTCSFITGDKVYKAVRDRIWSQLINHNVSLSIQTQTCTQFLSYSNCFLSFCFSEPDRFISFCIDVCWYENFYFT